MRRPISLPQAAAAVNGARALLTGTPSTPTVISSITVYGASFTAPITSPITADVPFGLSLNGAVIRIATTTSATAITDLTKISVRVRDNGFDTSGNATTVDRTIYIQEHLWRPYNHDSLRSPGTTGTFDLVLADFIFNQDATNKTTILGIDFAADWCTGGLAETVSTVGRIDSLAYPKTILRPHFLPYEVVSADGTNSTTEWAAFNRRWRNGQVLARVECRAKVAGNYGAWAGAGAETRSRETPASGRNPSGLAAPVYSIAGSVAGLAHATNHQAANWEWRAFPWIGPVLNSTDLQTPSILAAGGATTADADMGASASGADYNPMQMSVQVPFVLDATTPCCTPAVAWVLYDGTGTATTAAKVFNNSFTDPGTATADNFATFATAAAAIKLFNNARASGAHNDILGGVIMLRSVAGSAEGTAAGGYSTGSPWVSQSTYNCGNGRIEVRAVGGVPDGTIRLQGCTAAGGTITSTNHTVAQRVLWRGITFDGVAGQVPVGVAANIIIDGGSTDGNSTTRRTETGTANAAVSQMFVDCKATEAGSGANPMFRQCGYMYFIRTEHTNPFTATSVGTFGAQFAGLVMNIGGLVVEGNQDMAPCLLSGTRIQSTKAASANGHVVIRGAYNQVRPMNIIWQHSRVDYSSGTTKAFFLEGGASQDGLGMRGLFACRIGTTGTPIGYSIFSDNNWYAAQNITMVGVGADHEGTDHNSNRTNIGYNDIGWNPVARDIVDSFNAISCYAIKNARFNNTGTPLANGATHTTARIWLRGDIVTDATNGYQALRNVPTGTLLTDTSYWEPRGARATAFGPQALRVGNEAHTYHVGGVGTVGVTNAAGETAAGVNTYFGKVWHRGGALNTNYANWYKRRSTTLGDLGDYRPQRIADGDAANSPLLNRIPAGMAWAPFDMNGTAIPNDGTGAAGPFQA